jgi:hypothetical protein
MSFALRSTPDPECTPEECELLHELCVMVWIGRETERRGHAPRSSKPRSAPPAEDRAEDFAPLTSDHEVVAEETFLRVMRSKVPEEVAAIHNAVAVRFSLEVPLVGPKLRGGMLHVRLR